VEVHELSRSSRYGTFLEHVATPLPTFTDSRYEFSIGDVDYDGRPDLGVAMLTGTGSGSLEIHALGGSSFHQSWNLHSASAFSETSADVTTAGVLG
jgi:hypothetical protein